MTDDNPNGKHAALRGIILMLIAAIFLTALIILYYTTANVNLANPLSMWQPLDDGMWECVGKSVFRLNYPQYTVKVHEQTPLDCPGQLHECMEITDTEEIHYNLTARKELAGYSGYARHFGFDDTWLRVAGPFRYRLHEVEGDDGKYRQHTWVLYDKECGVWASKSEGVIYLEFDDRIYTP